MNVNNTSPINFGIKVDKALVEEIQDYTVKRFKDKTSLVAQNAKGDIGKKALHITSWGSDEFELVKTDKKVLGRGMFALKHIDSEKIKYHLKSNGKSKLHTAFMAIQKEDICEGIERLNAKLVVENYKKILSKKKGE